MGRFGPAAEEEFREERREAQRMAAAAAWEAEKADARVNKVGCPPRCGGCAHAALHEHGCGSSTSTCRVHVGPCAAACPCANNVAGMPVPGAFSATLQHDLLLQALALMVEARFMVRHCLCTSVKGV